MKKLGITGSELNDREEEQELLYEQSKDSNAVVGEKINNREMIKLLRKQNPGFSNSGYNYENNFKTQEMIQTSSPRETISSQVNTLLRRSNEKNPFLNSIQKYMKSSIGDTPFLGTREKPQVKKPILMAGEKRAKSPMFERKSR